jgi:choloylglycine hydrolase
MRAATARKSALPGKGAEESIGQMFHLLGTVEQVAGCARREGAADYRTVYTSCCNAERGIYYYTTYHCRSVVSVELWAEDLDGTVPVCYPMLERGCIYRQNG